MLDSSKEVVGGIPEPGATQAKAEQLTADVAAKRPSKKEHDEGIARINALLMQVQGDINQMVRATESRAEAVARLPWQNP